MLGLSLMIPACEIVDQERASVVDRTGASSEVTRLPLAPSSLLSTDVEQIYLAKTLGLGHF